MLRGRQRPTRSRAGGVVRGIDLPVFGKGSRPAGGGVSEVPFGGETGTDCLRLLQWLEPCASELRQGKQVSLLREVFAQQFVVEADGKIEPVKVHATGVVQNPHDPQAEWSAKGRGKYKKEWVGYKVQVAETVPKEEGQIGVITSVVTQRASESDDPGLELTLEKQAQMGH